MLTKAYAKINIGLDITGIREDGYHLLDMVMQTVDLCDELEILPRDDGKIVLSCDDPSVPSDDKNLAVKAAKMLLSGSERDGVSIFLKKNIPSQAGLGGGSSDAACVLKAVNEMYGLGRTEEELEKIASCIGADVPFFIKGGCQRCRGIGDILSPAEDDRGDFVIIVKPDAGVATKDVYEAYDRLGQKPDSPNVLESVTAKMYPVINEIKDLLIKSGAGYAGMSGSGTAVFGLFPEKPSESVINDIKIRFNNVFVVKKTKKNV